MKKIIYNKKGFTLADVLIGVAVFLIATTAIFSLTIHTLRISTQVTHDFEAINLARVGIEAFENIRSENTINTTTWENNPRTNLNSSNETCYTLTTNISGVDPWDLTKVNCPTIPTLEARTDIRLSKETMNGLTYYYHNSIFDPNKASQYYRVITLKKVVDPLTGANTYNNKVFNNYTSPISQYTLKEDDLIEVISTVYWKDNTEMRSKSLSKILTTWPKRI